MRRNRIFIISILVLCLLHLCGVAVIAVTPTENRVFSAQELEYLHNKHTLRVSVNVEERPFFHETEDGTLQGLPVMLLNRLAQQADLKLEYVPSQSYSQSLEQLQAGEVDIISIAMRHSGQIAYDADMSALEMVPYLTTQAVMVQHKNTDLAALQVITLASVTGRDIHSDNPRINEIFYAHSKACMNAVRSGQADTMICDSFTGGALLQRYEARDLVAVPAYLMLEYGFGVPEHADARLISALQKTIGSFTNDEITHALLNGSGYGYKNILEFIYRYPFEIICFGVAIMFVFSLSLAIYTKVKIRQHQALSGYEESYRLLSDTFGEAGMEYDYLNDSLTIFGQHSKLDIDQTVNDFTDKLQSKGIRIALTPDRWAHMINDGVAEKSFSAEFQCGVKSGEWVWYRLIYTVVCTSESHRRPIRLVGCLANIDAEHAEKERLLQLSSNDQLTGMLNHKTAEEQLHRMLEDTEAPCMGMMVVMDIDYFKKFNDRKGHLCGDEVLRSVGSTLREIFSQEDVLSRWGGDEFLLFIQEKPGYTQDFTDTIKCLRARMAAFEYDGEQCPVTLSVGGAKSYRGCTFNALFQQADDALYLAKKHGRNRFWLYEAAEQKPSKHMEDEQNEKQSQ